LNSTSIASTTDIGVGSPGFARITVLRGIAPVRSELLTSIEGDFVGMDMARKFLQMGYTRARRYANHKSGRKYDAGSKVVLPREEDREKAESARIFYEKWQKAREDDKYLELRKRHREMYEAESIKGRGKQDDA
jgi:hypothetical protein